MAWSPITYRRQISRWLVLSIQLESDKRIPFCIRCTDNNKRCIPAPHTHAGICEPISAWGRFPGRHDNDDAVVKKVGDDGEERIILVEVQGV